MYRKCLPESDGRSNCETPGGGRDGGIERGPGAIPATTIAVLAERGFSAEGQSSKPLRPEDLSSADLVINMTGRGGESIFSAPTPAFEDWDVGDPYGLDLAVYRGIRDQIETRVEGLAQRLRDKVNVRQSA
jgi:protein-tyrosine-phosphatase